MLDLEPTYGSIGADMQATIHEGVLYERTGHRSKEKGPWTPVADSREVLEALAKLWDRGTDVNAHTYRAKCLLSCLNDRDNMWRLEVKPGA